MFVCLFLKVPWLRVTHCSFSVLGQMVLLWRIIWLKEKKKAHDRHWYISESHVRFSRRLLLFSIPRLLPTRKQDQKASSNPNSQPTYGSGSRGTGFSILNSFIPQLTISIYISYICCIYASFLFPQIQIKHTIQINYAQFSISCYFLLFLFLDSFLLETYCHWVACQNGLQRLRAQDQESNA